MLRKPPPGVAAIAGLLALGCRTGDAPGAADERSVPRPAASPLTSTGPLAPTGTPRATEAIDPCRLLTVEEASEALAGPVTATPSDRLEYATSCIWEAAAPRRGLVVMVSTPEQLRNDPALPKTEGDTVARRFARVVELEAGGGAEPVSGLGDAALYSERRRQLWIAAQGRALVTVSFHGEAALSEARERSQTVAKRMLARL